MTRARHGYEVLPAHRSLFWATTIPVDFRIAYLWAALGLALTGLFYATGFGAEIGQALIAAG